jgi:hypothetical protein
MAAQCPEDYLLQQPITQSRADPNMVAKSNEESFSNFRELLQRLQRLGRIDYNTKK